MSVWATEESCAEDLTPISEARVRHYHSGDHIPYRGMLHDLYTDERIDWVSAVRSKLAMLPEGAIVAIEIQWRAPEHEPTDVYVLLEPHKYGMRKEGE